MIEVSLLSESDEAEYEGFLTDIEFSLLYCSSKHKHFLQKILSNSEPLYLIARDAGRMVGALPAFLCRNEKYGNALNSLPFYGSNGGVIVSADTPRAVEIKRGLLGAFDDLARDRSVVVSTLISNPLDPDVDFYESNAAYTVRDERIGQITRLPLPAEDLSDRLFDMFHKNTRTGIRRAKKSKIMTTHSDSLDHLKMLVDIHQTNIQAIGGTAKPLDVFLAIQEVFQYDKDYRLYIARREDKLIAALLVFYYNRIAEYYTPATMEDERIHQPMSLLVFEAMQEAARRGCRYWNWGGTWLTQDGVYNFKKRWGTSEYRYYYFTKVYNQGLLRVLLDLPSETLRHLYPGFFLFPYNARAHLSK